MPAGARRVYTLSGVTNLWALWDIQDYGIHHVYIAPVRHSSCLYCTGYTSFMFILHRLHILHVYIPPVTHSSCLYSTGYTFFMFLFHRFHRRLTISKSSDFLFNLSEVLHHYLSQIFRKLRASWKRILRFILEKVIPGLKAMG